jgi:hypothetical protein
LPAAQPSGPPAIKARRKVSRKAIFAGVEQS